MSGQRAPILEVRDVSLAFGGLRAVDRVSFAIERGGIVALVGPNGAGKTSLFNLIAGLYVPDSGEIRFDGRSLRGVGVHQRVRLGMSRTFQNSRLVADLTVRENVLVPLATLFPFSDARRRADAAIADFGLGPKADMHPGELSTADRKVVELCRALAWEPVLLCLDEIFSGMTDEEIGHYLGFLLNATERGVTLFFVEHLMQVVRRVARHVLVMNFGQLIAKGDPEEVLTDPVVVEAYLGRNVLHARDR